MAKRKRVITDGIEILDRLYYRGRPRRIAALDAERLRSDIAQQIYDLRTAAQMTQRALAAQVGTTASVISRLEDTDYTGHSMSMLRRIAKVFGCRVDLRFVPESSKLFPYTRAWLRSVKVKCRNVPAARNGKPRRAVG
jgi:transcriptional regulator with XRE-family HTH domain